MSETDGTKGARAGLPIESELKATTRCERVKGSSEWKIGRPAKQESVKKSASGDKKQSNGGTAHKTKRESRCSRCVEEKERQKAGRTARQETRL
jgi:hypothetical protein